MHARVTMRATLIYNQGSGTAVTADELSEGLEGIGWEVTRRLDKKEMDNCICFGADVVVVAGGDGTVERVAKRLAGTGVPMAVVPMGTANNVARSLGLGVEASSAVHALRHAVERRIDLGVVTGRRRKDYFLEGFGVGVFAYVMGERVKRGDKKLRRALALMADELEDYEPRRVELDVDGSDCSGKYILVAVMNMRSFGPALAVAPEAKCDDGELDVVLVRPEAKHALVTHLRRAATEGDIALPAFETMRASKVRLGAIGRWAHLDDVAHQLDEEVCVDAAAGAVKLLAPERSPLRASPGGG